jgi:hypothetical protein
MNPDPDPGILLNPAPGPGIFLNPDPDPGILLNPDRHPHQGFSFKTVETNVDRKTSCFP